MKENVVNLQEFKEKSAKGMFQKIETSIISIRDKITCISNYIFSKRDLFQDLAFRELENGKTLSIYIQGKDFLGHIVIHNIVNSFVEICFQKVSQSGRKEKQTFVLKDTNVSNRSDKKMFNCVEDVVNSFYCFFCSTKSIMN